MTKPFTLDSFREAADKNFGVLAIPFTHKDEELYVNLVNPLRLTKAKRTELLALQGASDDDSEEARDQEEVLAESILVVAESAPHAKLLLKEINGDLGVLVEIFKQYSKSSELGEA